MFILLSLICIFILISCALIILAKMVSSKSFLDYQKISPFECGFDPKVNSRLPLSLQFFLTAIIFLIFDVEITLLLPIPLMMNHNSIMAFSIVCSAFLLILLFGLFYEWKKGALNWMV